MILLTPDAAERAAFELLSNVMTKGQKKLFIEAGILDRRGRPPKGLTLRESFGKARLRDLKRLQDVVRSAGRLIDDEYHQFERTFSSALRLLISGLAETPPKLSANWNECRTAAAKFERLSKQNVNELIRAVMFGALSSQLDETKAKHDRCGFDVTLTMLLMLPAARAALEKLSMQLAGDLPIDTEGLSHLWTRLAAGVQPPSSPEEILSPTDGLCALSTAEPTSVFTRRVLASLTNRSLERLLKAVQGSSAVRGILAARVESVQDPNFFLVMASLLTRHDVPTQLQLELLPKLYTAIYDDVSDAIRADFVWQEIQRAMHQASTHPNPDGTIKDGARSALRKVVQASGIRAWLLAVGGWLSGSFTKQFETVGRDLAPIRLADVADWTVSDALLEDQTLFQPVLDAFDRKEIFQGDDPLYGVRDETWAEHLGSMYLEGIQTAPSPKVRTTLAKFVEKQKQREKSVKESLQGLSPLREIGGLKTVQTARMTKAEKPVSAEKSGTASPETPESIAASAAEPTENEPAVLSPAAYAAKRVRPARISRSGTETVGRTKLSEALAATATGEEPERDAWPEYLTAATVHVEPGSSQAPADIPKAPKLKIHAEIVPDAAGNSADQADAKPAKEAEQSAAAPEALLTTPFVPATVFPIADETTAPALSAPPTGRRLLGVIRLWDKFINFYPVAEWLQGTFKLRSSESLRHEFPQHGAVGLLGWTRARPVEGELFVIELLPGELNTSPNPDYVHTIDAGALIRDKRLRPAADYGVLPVVTVEAGACRETRTPLVVDAVWPGRGNVLAVEEGARELLYVGPYPIRENASRKPYVQLPMKDAALGTGVLRGFRENASAEDPSASLMTTSVFSGVDADNNPVFETVAFAFAKDASLSRVAIDVLEDDVLLEELAPTFADAEASGDVPQASQKIPDLLTGSPEIAAARAERIAERLKRARDVRAVVQGMTPWIAGIVADAFRIAARTSAADEGGASLRPDEDSGIGAKTLTDEDARAIVEAATTSDAVLSRIAAHKRVADEIEAMKTSLEKLKREESDAAALCRAKKLETEAIVREAESARETLEETRRVLGIRDALAPLAVVRDEIRTSIAELEAERQRAAQELRREADEVGKYLSEQVRNARNVAFEGAVAAKFAEAAAEWTERAERDDCEARVDLTASLPKLALTGRNLVEHLVTELTRRRAYARDDVINLYLTITQHFLTIFAGAPGSGKTSGCMLLADAMGLVETERFLPVSVERGWTSKRDFIGYWNPLTKRFESADPMRWEAVRRLDVEARRADAAAAGINTRPLVDLPYIMLLDEANLSPMEYYWADFMNLADDRGRLAFLSLGGNARCRVPEHLRFLATINSDFTTEALSPRLLDRAAIVTLPEADVSDEPDEPIAPAGLVSWKAMVETFGAKPASASVAARVQHLEKLAAAVGVTPSIRTRKSMLGYAAAGADLFGSVETALDFAASQKLLPKINAVGEAAREGLEAFMQEAKAHDWQRTEAALATIIAKGDESLGCWRYFG